MSFAGVGRLLLCTARALGAGGGFLERLQGRAMSSLVNLLTAAAVAAARGLLLLVVALLLLFWVGDSLGEASEA